MVSAIISKRTPHYPGTAGPLGSSGRDHRRSNGDHFGSGGSQGLASHFLRFRPDGRRAFEERPYYPRTWASFSPSRRAPRSPGYWLTTSFPITGGRAKSKATGSEVYWHDVRTFNELKTFVARSN